MRSFPDVALWRGECSDRYWSQCASTIPPSARVLHNFQVERKLSRTPPAPRLRPGCAGERIYRRPGTLADCSVELSRQRRTRLLPAPDAPARGPRLVRNRSTEAFLNWTRMADS